MNDCSQCPKPDWDGTEIYRFIVAAFDVRKAREIIAASPRPAVSLSTENLRAMGLPLTPPRREGSTIIECGFSYVNESHLPHIPADKLTEPCIVLPFRTWSRKEKNDIKSHILIDGTHRAVRLHREGKPVTACMLTEKEALAICLNRESTWWKGLRSPKVKKQK